MSEHRLKNAEEAEQFVWFVFDEAGKIQRKRKNVDPDAADAARVLQRWCMQKMEEATPEVGISLGGISLSLLDPDDVMARWEALVEISSDIMMWGEWSAKHRGVHPYGYSDCDPIGRRERYSPSRINSYDAVPEPVVWTALPIEQKGVTFYIARAKVCEVDAVCAVPSLPTEDVEANETGKRVLDKESGKDEWQRELSLKRMHAISSFIDHNSNIIANAPMLFIRKSEHSKVVNKEGYCEIHISMDFLEQWPDGRWSDHDYNEWDVFNPTGALDRRPVWLIDGQHRIRGMSLAREGHKFEIPIILFVPDEDIEESFDLEKAAKVFSEINTLQESLDPLHELFMAHRFRIPSPKTKRDFRPWRGEKEELEEGVYRRSRANTLAYELAAKLASYEDSPLYDMIRILKNNPARRTVVKADQWVDFAREWFLTADRPFGPDCTLEEVEILTEVSNYFQAFIDTCNHGEHPDDPRPRWKAGKARGKSLIQQHTTFVVLLWLFTDVYERVQRHNPESSHPYTLEQFRNALSPLKWVDWLDENLMRTFGGGGEQGRRALSEWLKNAIRHDAAEAYTRNQVMTKSRKYSSKPGQGILSPPASPEIGITERSLNKGVTWPTPERPLWVFSKQLTNTLPTATWMLTFDRSQMSGPDRRKASSADKHSEFRIDHEDWMEMEGKDHIDIQVTWSNRVPAGGSGTYRLSRDGSLTSLTPKGIDVSPPPEE